MLVMMDRGLYGYWLIDAVLRRGAHVLCRVPKNIKLVRERSLGDRTYLAWISEAGNKKQRGRGRLMRIIDYRLPDPERPSRTQRIRLATDLLDPRAYRARELAVGYHERWEVENAFREEQSHLLRPKRPLRSLRPEGVRQEIYGML